MVPFLAKYAIQSDYGIELTNACEKMNEKIICHYASKVYSHELCVQHLITNQTGKICWFVLHKPDCEISFERNFKLLIDNSKYFADNQS